MVKKPGPPSVLVVDDEPLIRWSIAETLGEDGHAVTEAKDAATALAALAASPVPPDVVLLDYRLPDSNDLTLLETIRRVAPRSQVIVMTAFGTPEIVKGALDLGAYRVVSKPFEVHELTTLIAQAHASRRE